MPDTMYTHGPVVFDQQELGEQTGHDVRPDNAAPQEHAEHGDCDCLQFEEGAEQDVSEADASIEALAGLDEEDQFIFAQDFPKARRTPDPDCKRDHCDWTNLNLQLNHLRCGHSIDEQRLLKTLYRKVTYIRKDDKPGYWNNQSVWDNYDKRACLLAHSSYDKRLSFCLCGNPRHDKKSSCCGDITFCPRCNHKLRREPMQAEFGNCFSSNQEALFITLSLSRDPAEANRIVYKDLTKSDWEQIAKQGLRQPHRHAGLPFMEPSECLQCQDYWRLFNDAIKQAKNKHRISGAFGSLELAVRFRMLGVIPHAHYVAFSIGFSHDYARDLRRTLKRLIRQTRVISEKLHPSVAVYRIQNPEDYRRVIKYVYKPIKIEQAYDFAADHIDHDPQIMKLLNLEVNTFLESLEGAFLGIQRTFRCGICSPLADGYCGMVTPERRKEREASAKYRKQKKAERAEIEELLPGFKGHKRRRTREEKLERRDLRMHVKQAIRDGDLPSTPVRPWRKRKRCESPPAPKAPSSVTKHSVSGLPSP